MPRHLFPQCSIFSTKWEIKKRILYFLYSLLAVTVLGLTVISALVYRTFNDAMQQSRSLIHTRQVLFEAENVISILKDGEAGQHGFLVLRDSAFLAPYFAARDSIDGNTKLIYKKQ